MSSRTEGQAPEDGEGAALPPQDRQQGARHVQVLGTPQACSSRHTRPVSSVDSRWRSGTCASAGEHRGRSLARCVWGRQPGKGFRDCKLQVCELRQRSAPVAEPKATPAKDTENS